MIPSQCVQWDVQRKVRVLKCLLILDEKHRLLLPFQFPSRCQLPKISRISVNCTLNLFTRGSDQSEKNETISICAPLFVAVRMCVVHRHRSAAESLTKRSLLALNTDESSGSRRRGPFNLYLTLSALSLYHFGYTKTQNITPHSIITNGNRWTCCYCCLSCLFVV